MSDASTTRRGFVHVTAVTATGLLVGGMAAPQAFAADKEKEKEEEDVSPAEDLMREHGVLKRILLVYGEAIRRIDARQDLPPDPVLDSAKIVRSFVEDY